jgi:hypothetical protein
VRVSEEDFSARLESVSGALSSLRQHLEDGEADDAVSSNLRIRFEIADDTVEEATEDLATGRWHALSYNLTYLESAASRFTNEIQTGSLPEELSASLSAPDLAALEIEGGTFFVDDTPVYLFGRAQTKPESADFDTLHRYGLNLSTLTIAPDDALRDAENVQDIGNKYDAAFNAAAEKNVSLAVQLAPHVPSAWMRERWPDLDDKGFVDLAHAGVEETYNRLIENAIPYLTQQEMLNSVSIAYHPTFRFDNEATQNAFIERIRSQYLDAQHLNRLWHAKLAAFEEIEIWSKQPADWFQDRRAYQFDWQTFHMQLATDYFLEAIEKIRALSPALALHATLPDNAFEEGETRSGVDREALIAKLDVSACTTLSTPESLYYALNYPRPSAPYALMKSIAPHKPVFDMQWDIQIDADASPDQIYNYVYTVLWEAVMSGVSAAALPHNSPVFDNPWALEAFATAAQDVNRLSTLVIQFQQAPTEVAVLFSNAAKVLDDGDPHLSSSWFAFEGSSFGGYNVRFATEDAINDGLLDELPVLVLPQTPAVKDITFEKIAAYARNDNVVARIGTPIPYNERGESRKEVIRHTGKTILVHGINLPTEFLHAIDAAVVLGGLPEKTRTISSHGYPIEGVKSRLITHGGDEYMYLVNLRQEPIEVNLSTGTRTARDVMRGRDIAFPTTIEPLDPLLLRFNKNEATPGPEKVRRNENLVKKYLEKAKNKVF